MSARATLGRYLKGKGMERAPVKHLNLCGGVDSNVGRLLETTLGDPASNLALEEALFEMVEEPTLRVWRNQKSVVIGRAQVAAYETDLEECKRRGVPVLRRFTAGGTVYHGPGNLNWSFFVPVGKGREGKRDPAGVFSEFGGFVVGALGRCGVEARLETPNSIVAKGGKISGMAAYISKRAILCHGTLLVGADLEEVQALTRPSGGSVHDRYPRSRHVVVSNSGVEEDRFVRELKTGSNMALKPWTLGRAELGRVSELVASKYSSREWNLGDPFGLDDPQLSAGL